jgi:AcrR family transcriptional regulator
MLGLAAERSQRPPAAARLRKDGEKMASPRVERKKAATRERILKAAVQIFSEQGIEKAKLADVAETLGMTAPALYYYFPSKEELVFACCVGTLDEMIVRIREAAAGAGRDPIDRIKAIITAQMVVTPLLNAVLFGPQYLVNLLQEPQRERIVTQHRTLLNLYRSAINDGVAQGLFSTDEPTIAAFNILAMVQYSSIWFRKAGRRSAQSIAQEQIGFALKMLSARAEPAEPALARGLRTSGRVAAGMGGGR